MRKTGLNIIVACSLFSATLLFFTACSDSQSGSVPDDAIARVYDEYLTLEDIEDIVPPDVTPEDSTQIINDYIDNWIRKKLLLKQAEKNLSKEQKDFDRQLEDYRSSLIIFTYQQELIRQSVDTVVTENEIVTYYNKNKADFTLKDNIVKVRYVKLPKGKNIPPFRRLLQSDEDADFKKLLELTTKYAVNSYLDDESWLVFDDILKEIPIKTYNQEEYLKNNDFIEIEDSLYTYLMSIKGFMIKESVSPLSFELENIRAIIINKRKLDLIGQMEKSVYDEAVKSKSVELIKIEK